LTTDKDFKRLVRDRAQKTGESYALARNRLFSKTRGIPVSANPDEFEKIVTYSEEQARMLGHDFVGTEHLLLGLMVDDQCAAAQALVTFDVNSETVRTELQRIVEFTETSAVDALPQTSRAKKAIRFAEEEVVELGDSALGSGHVLLGLIKEAGGVAILILNRLDVDLQQLRTVTLRNMGVDGS
jgi:ATP-dependent Clp protease ATP-binding subunit ClpC